MRTETTIVPEHIVTTTYYRYDELSDDVKEQVKVWYTEHFRWTDYFSDCVKQDLENILGKNNLDVQYSLGHSQGDGLNIYGKIDAKRILDFMGSDVTGELSRKYADVLTEDVKNVIRGYCEFDNGYWHDFGMIDVPKNKYHYSFCVADGIDIADSWYGEMEYFELDCNYGLLKKFEDAVISLFTELCRMYEEWGYKYFYEVSDEEMIDICDANGWEFDEDGNLL